MLKPLSQNIMRLGKAFGVDRSIAKKIGYGYALALGTAVVGISGGFIGSHYYAQSAQIQAQAFQEKKQLLSDLNAHLFSIQIYPLRLLAIAGESRIWVQYEAHQFRTEHRQIERLLNELEQLTNEFPQPNTQLIDLTAKYRVVLTSCKTFARDLWNGVSDVDEKQVATETLAAALSSPTASQLSTNFEKLSEDLTRQKQIADQSYYLATRKLQRAEQLRLAIVLGSMALSIGLAIFLATIASRAIARPIEQLTAVAQRVTQDNNFQLQASIQTQDEVSFLAKALNQLVQWAGQYTAELEEAHKALQTKNQDLQQSEDFLRHKAEDLQQALDELQRAQLQLVQSEKMSSLGQMIAGVAHEINNPVSFIHGNLRHAVEYTEDVMRLIDLYQSHYPDPNSEIQTAIEDIDLPFLQEDFPKLLRSMKDGTRRIRDIVISLRTFSRLDEAAVKHVDLHHGIDSTLTLLNNRLKATSNSPEIAVIRQYGEMPPIECYAGQLNQVFMNILSNAIDALETLPEGTEPTITITTHTVNPEFVAIHIKDNGPGISEIACHRLFDPFFTTKAVGKGTGMGLSISYQVVTETHKGQLTCESSLGEGAEFIIKLPVKL